MRRGHVVVANEESDGPGGSSVGGQGNQRHAQDQREQRSTVFGEIFPDYAEGQALEFHSSGSLLDKARAFARRIAQRKEHQDKSDSGNSEKQEKSLPGANRAKNGQLKRFVGAEGTQQQAAKQKGESTADVSGHGVDAEGEGAFGGRKRIRDHGV